MPEPTEIIAVTNQKGGVGKTTTAINLAAALAALGRPTLLVDLDPQGNASTGVGIRRQDRQQGSYALLLSEDTAGAYVRSTETPSLSIIPADSNLAGAEIELVDVPGREFRLKQRLDGLDGSFETIVIDCPPSLGLLTLNALAAATTVLIPLQCEFFALEGVTQLLRTVEAVTRNFNPGLRIGGLVLTMFDRRNNLSELVASDARSFFGDRLFQTVIPRNIRLSEAPSHGKPVLQYDPACAGAAAYTKLAEEWMQRKARS